MRVIVIGSGGREHALAWRLVLSESVTKVAVWPGNGGTERAGLNLSAWNQDRAAPDASAAVAAQAVALADWRPDLVVIGPEQPLVAGLADRLRELGIPAFGPGADGARLEGSKIFAKRFFQRHDLPTAAAREVSDDVELARALDELGGNVVLKADGLAAGKGVVLPSDREEALREGMAMLGGGAFGDAGRRLLVEECLEGWELSLLAVCDGESYYLLPPSQDHKRALEGDRGPNTGGMGAYSPVSGVNETELLKIADGIFGATLKGLRDEGIDYRGVLYAGLMMTASGPKLLEYNCRFGDPETQAVLPRLEGDFGRLLMGAAAGDLDSAGLSHSAAAAITVVLSSEGYPGAYDTGFAIEGLDEIGDGLGDCLVFHAGTRLDGDTLRSSGGRVLAVTALGDDLSQAADRCYRRIDGIGFENRCLRRDIGWRALTRGASEV